MVLFQLLRPGRGFLKYFFGSICLLLSSSFVFAENYGDLDITENAVFEYKAVYDFNDLADGDHSFHLANFTGTGLGSNTIGAAYESVFTVVANTDKHGGTEKVGKHAKMSKETWMHLMTAGTKGVNFFGCYLSGLNEWDQIEIWSAGKEKFTIRGWTLYREEEWRHKKNRFGHSNLPHFYYSFSCYDCQLEKVKFSSGSGDPVHTDRHTIGWVNYYK